jgi:hypothetical protein
MKNLQGKTVKTENAYEVWQTTDLRWTWYVLKFYTAEDKRNEPYTRVFCSVRSPFCTELGDVYYKDIKQNATKIWGINGGVK